MPWRPSLSPQLRSGVLHLRSGVLHLRSAGDVYDDYLCPGCRLDMLRAGVLLLAPCPPLWSEGLPLIERAHSMGTRQGPGEGSPVLTVWT
jgi:hypothetical protein